MNEKTVQRFLALRKKYIENQFARLNDEQKDAVYTVDGPLLILAGAGSGKTTVLVNRVANMVRFGSAAKAKSVRFDVTEDDCKQLEALIKSNAKPNADLAVKLRDNAVRPYNILAITFTNKAARELKERLCKMLGEIDANDINASTFHSACVRILKRNAEIIGFPKTFTIYDTDDSKRALKEVYKKLQIDDKFLPMKSAMGAISSLKDKMIGPSEALANAQHNVKNAIVAKIYAEYAKNLKALGAMDFDDLIFNTVKLLSEHSDVLSYYQNLYKYILVDEYQDTSVAQFMLVDLLSKAHNNICVVGDDDQSIYKFRGATIENILQFEQHYPKAKIIRLEENYRSSSNILNAANAVIKNNVTRKGKTLWTSKGDGALIEHFCALDESDEAAHIAEIIGQNLKNGAKLSHHAVLYRMNSQSQPVETYFARAGIPSKVFSGQRFYNRKEIKDIHAYMQIVSNRKDDGRLKRIINEPARKIGATSVEAINNLASEEGKNMLDICENIRQYPNLSRAFSHIESFYKMYENLCETADNLPLDVFANKVFELTGYKQMLENEGEEGKTRLENIGQLISSIKVYCDERASGASLEGYLEEIALISDLDSYDENADFVSLMTMHTAKGLEFPFVFIVGMEESIFPSEMCRFDERELEEERRLCYVGLTRAKKALYLSSTSTRFVFGQTQRNRPSRFLGEIDENLLNCTQSEKTEQNNMYSAQSREYGQARGGFGGGFGGQGTRSAGNADFTARRTQNFSGGAKGSFESKSFGGNYKGGFGAAASANGGGFGTNKSSVVGAGGFGANMASAQKAQGGKSATASYKKGDAVEHKVFGKGVVQNVTPVAGDFIVEIKFETVGVKKTMANYAPLKIIE